MVSWGGSMDYESGEELSAADQGPPWSPVKNKKKGKGKGKAAPLLSGQAQPPSPWQVAPVWVCATCGCPHNNPRAAVCRHCSAPRAPPWQARHTLAQWWPPLGAGAPKKQDKKQLTKQEGKNSSEGQLSQGGNLPAVRKLPRIPNILRHLDTQFEQQRHGEQAEAPADTEMDAATPEPPAHN